MSETRTENLHHRFSCQGCSTHYLCSGCKMVVGFCLIEEGRRTWKCGTPTLCDPCQAAETLKPPPWRAHG